MTDDPQPDVQTHVPGKWWAASRTVWGALITALATVLPTLAPILGISIPPELVQQLGDQVVLVLQAGGGLVGTILTIYGRARATSALERRRVTLNL